MARSSDRYDRHHRRRNERSRSRRRRSSTRRRNERSRYTYRHSRPRADSPHRRTRYSYSCSRSSISSDRSAGSRRLRNKRMQSPHQSSKRPRHSRNLSPDRQPSSYLDRRNRSPSSPRGRNRSRVTRPLPRRDQYDPYPRRSDRIIDDTDAVIAEARKAVGIFTVKAKECNSTKRISPPPRTPESAPSPASSFDCPANGTIANDKKAVQNLKNGVKTPSNIPRPLDDCTSSKLECSAYIPGVHLLDGPDLAQGNASRNRIDFLDMSNSSLDRTNGSSKLAQDPELLNPKRHHQDVSSISVDSAAHLNGRGMAGAEEARNNQPPNASSVEGASSSSSSLPVPALHLHLSEDGSSPIPPGWERAPNTTASSGSQSSSQPYPYYYYHVKTRVTRWDPPVYPWDADPSSQVALPSDWSSDNPGPHQTPSPPADFGSSPVRNSASDASDSLEPDSPYNWGNASRFQVTHDDIEALYNRIRAEMLEKQCLELIHELAHLPDCPKGPLEQPFAIELYALIHNTLREFRDARCLRGRIANDEDLHFITRKLSQMIILKEIQKMREIQANQSNSLFLQKNEMVTPELTPAIEARVKTHVRRYMEAKGSVYRRQGTAATLPQPGAAAPPPPQGHHHHQHHNQPQRGNNHGRGAPRTLHQPHPPLTAPPRPSRTDRPLVCDTSSRPRTSTLPSSSFQSPMAKPSLNQSSRLASTEKAAWSSASVNR